MSMRFFIRCFWALAILVLSTAVPLAQDRLIIDVSKVMHPQFAAGGIHYQGTGSVRHSEQRTYEAAQDRRTAHAAEDRREGQRAQGRRTTGAESRHEVQRAGDRTYGTATDRYGSVRLDTIR